MHDLWLSIYLHLNFVNIYFSDIICNMIYYFIFFNFFSDFESCLEWRVLFQGMFKSFNWSFISMNVTILILKHISLRFICFTSCNNQRDKFRNKRQYFACHWIQYSIRISNVFVLVGKPPRQQVIVWGVRFQPSGEYIFWFDVLYF